MDRRSSTTRSSRVALTSRFRTCLPQELLIRIQVWNACRKTLPRQTSSTQMNFGASLQTEQTGADHFAVAGQLMPPPDVFQQAPATMACWISQVIFGSL